MRKKIAAQDIPLTETLKTHIKAFDFSIFRAKQPLELINEHAQTKYHLAVFGLPLIQRPPPPNLRRKWQQKKRPTSRSSTRSSLNILALTSKQSLILHRTSRCNEFSTDRALLSLTQSRHRGGSITAIPESAPCHNDLGDKR